MFSRPILAALIAACLGLHLGSAQAQGYGLAAPDTALMPGQGKSNAAADKDSVSKEPVAKAKAASAQGKGTKPAKKASAKKGPAKKAKSAKKTKAGTKAKKSKKRYVND